MRTKLALPMVCFCLLAVTATAAASTAPPPVTGTYLSGDLGGGVYTGRISESWTAAPAGYGHVGNTILATSTSGPSLGTQWELWCASITVQPTLVSDIRDSTDTGEVVWSASYTGGRFWLADDGPWAGPGATDYTGAVDFMVATVTYRYHDGCVIGVETRLTVSGRLDPDVWDGSCIECTFDRVSFIGSTDLESKPGDYPAFMAPDCAPATAGLGAWGDISGIEIRIFDCVQTPVKEATWGEIKALFGG